jgi:hypothetical protein
MRATPAPVRSLRAGYPRWAWIPAVLLTCLLVGSAVAGAMAYLLIALLAAPLLVVMFRRPQKGLLVLATLAPLNGLLPLFTPSRTAAYWKEGLVAALVIVILVKCITGERRSFRQVWWSGFLGVLVVIGVVSAAFEVSLQAAYGLKLDFFYVLLAWAAWQCPLSAKERDQLATSFMATGLLAALYGIAQQGLGGTRLHDLGYAYNTTITFNGAFLKSFGTFDSAHGFGFYEMFVVLFGLAVALSDLTRRRNKLFLALLPVYLGGMVFSLTRGAFVGAAVGLLYLGLRRYRVLLLCIPIGLVALLWLPSSFTSTSLNPKSAQERVGTWSKVPGLVASHPFGTGIGTTGSAVDKARSGSPFSNTSPAASSGDGTLSANSSVKVAVALPDNYYVQTLTELGVLGLWAACLFLGVALVGLHRASDSPLATDRTFIDATSTVVVAAIVSSFTATYFSLFPMDLLFWLTLGVASSVVPVASAGEAARLPVATPRP